MNHHMLGVDSDVEFETPNLIKSKSSIEWEFVVNPKLPKKEGDAAVIYPERDGIPEGIRRKPLALKSLMDRAEELCNSKLRKDGHSELIREEVVGGTCGSDVKT